MDETASELVCQFGAKAPQHVVDQIVAAVRENDHARMNVLNHRLRAVERELADQAEARRYAPIGISNVPQWSGSDA